MPLLLSSVKWWHFSPTGLGKGTGGTVHVDLRTLTVLENSVSSDSGDSNGG